MMIRLPLALSTIVVCALLSACGGGADTAAAPVPSPEPPTTSSSDALPFQKTFTRRAGAPILDQVELTAFQQSQVKELTVRITNGGSGPAATDGTIEVGGVRVLSSADFPLTEKVIKVNIGTVRPVRLVTTISGATGGSFSVRIEAGVPVTANGGTIEVAGGSVSIAVPNGAVAGNVSISAEPLTRTASDDFIDGYEFGPSGTTFSKPITLTFPAPTLPAGAKPLLYWRQTKTDRWTPLIDTRYDAVARTVTGSISHFTEIALRVGEALVCPNTVDAAPTVSAGVALVPDNGTVLLCDAEHVISAPVTISKPLTITSVSGPRARITATTSGAALVVGGFATDSVSISNVNVTASSGFVAVGSGAQSVRIADVSVVLPSVPTAGYGISFTSNANTNARATIRRSRFVGGSGGVSVIGNATVGIEDNSFDSTSVAVRFESAGTARPRGAVVRNTFGRCAGLRCVAGLDADSLDVRENTFSAGGPTAISVSARKARVLDNVIGTTEAIVGPTSDAASYPFGRGIEVASSSLHAVYAEVSGNRVSKTGRGLLVTRSTAPGATDVTVEGSNNVFDQHAFGVEVNHGAHLFLSRNDFARTGQASVREVNAVAGRASLTTNGSDLSCNWWGGAAGPVNIAGSPIVIGAPTYTVWSETPIAGTTVGCSTTQVRVCPGRVGALETIAEGVAAVAAGGIVRLCEAQHLVSDTIRISKPLTITSVPGARAHILSPTAVFAFSVEGFQNDSVVFSRVSGTVRGFLRARGRYPNVRVEDVELTGDRIINTLFFESNSNAGAVATVTRSRFTNGQIQVNSTVGSRQLNVIDNDFTGAGFASVLLQGLSSSIDGNRFVDCQAVGCIAVSQGDFSRIANNRITGRSIGSILQRVITAAVRTARITDNRVEGAVPVSGDPGNIQSYAFREAIVVLGMTAYPVFAEVSRNVVDGASRGIQLVPTTENTQGVIVEGQDNRLSNVGYAIEVQDGGIVRLTRNDFTGIGIAGIWQTNATARPTMNANGSSLRCNWWGNSAGPFNVGSSPVAIAGSVYSPLSAQPIAGTGASCGP